MRYIREIVGPSVTARLYKDVEEYVVKFYKDGVYQEEADYFADDYDDAWDTALHQTGMNKTCAHCNKAFGDHHANGYNCPTKKGAMRWSRERVFKAA